MRQQWYCLLKSCCFLFLVFTVSPALAQSNAELDPATRHTMETAAAQGFPLPSTLVVAGVGTATQAPAATPAAKKSAKGGKGQKGTNATAAQTSPPAAAAQGAATDATNPASTPAKTTGKSANVTAAPANAGNVIDNASVQSVLLPYDVCKRVFGKEVALHYAAVALIISNRSSSASLIVHSIFIDYSKWALSGSMYIAPPLSNTAQPDSGSGKGSTPTTTGSPYPPYEVPNDPTQVASVEYRIVRGEALDAQPYTTRNWIMRSLDLAGAIATAYSFSISEQGIIRGISAFTGQVTPAAKVFIPDNTVEQLNRISDLAFRVNKVIAKGSSDIVVAFFPIDRFLTPGLKKLYLKSPALFFAPYALVLDKEARDDLVPIVAVFMPGSDDNEKKEKAKRFLNEVAVQYMIDVARQSERDFADQQQAKSNAKNGNGSAQTGKPSQGTGQTQPAAANQPSAATTTAQSSSEAGTSAANNVQNPLSLTPQSGSTTIPAANNPMETACKDVDYAVYGPLPPDSPLTPQQTCYIKKFLANASLNTVHVVVGGEMTIDVTKVPATITSIDMDNGNSNADTWKASTQTGVIQGSFLTNGTPNIKEAKDQGITGIKAVTEGSSDTTLHFTMTLSKDIPDGTKLTFTVTKKDNDGNTVTSMPFVLTTGSGSSSTSQITGAQVKNNVVTISGGGFPTAKPDSMTISLHSDIAKPSDYTLNNKGFTIPNASEIDIKLEGLQDKDGKAVSLTAGCWTAKATVDSKALDGEAAFPIFPDKPAVTSAKISSDSKTVDVIGTNFVDLAACSNPLVFKLLNNSSGKSQRVTGYKPKSATEVVFDFPATPTGVTWNVLVGYRDATGKGVAVTK